MFKPCCWRACHPGRLHSNALDIDMLIRWDLAAFSGPVPKETEVNSAGAVAKIESGESWS